MRVFMQVARMAAEELGASAPAVEKSLLAEGTAIAKGAKSLAEEAYSLMRAGLGGSAHTTEAAAKGAIKSAVKADAPASSSAISSRLADEAERLQTAPLSSQLRFIADHSHDIIGSGGKFGDALVGRQNNTLSVMFDSGRFKGAQALIDNNTILYQRGSHVVDLPLDKTGVTWTDPWSKFVNGR